MEIPHFHEGFLCSKAMLSCHHGGFNSEIGLKLFVKPLNQVNSVGSGRYHSPHLAVNINTLAMVIEQKYPFQSTKGYPRDMAN